MKYFIQVNIGNEIQKSGVAIDNVDVFIKFCIFDLIFGFVLYAFKIYQKHSLR
jgi:hypothetical protein